MTTPAAFVRGTSCLVLASLWPSMALALGTVDQVCPAVSTSMAVWKGQVWQQEARAGVEGQLATVTLAFIGPVSGATLRLRRGPAPSVAPVLFETTIGLEDAGPESVTVDITAAGIFLPRGGLLVIEVEGSEKPEGSRGGLLGASAGATACSAPLFQNGTTVGVSPSVRLAFTTHMCQGTCDPDHHGAPIVVTKISAALALATNDDVSPTPNPNLHERHMDESWSEHPRDPERLVVAFETGLDAQSVSVRLPGAKASFGAAAALRALAVGESGVLTYRAAGAVALGGQTTGFSTRLQGDAALGLLLRWTHALHLFANAGTAISSYADGELDTSVFTLPSLAAGVQVVTPSLVVSLAPRAGATLRAAYAPGNEEEGRRYHRSSQAAPSWGAGANVFAPFGFLEGAFDRVQQTNGLWTAHASACGYTGSPATSAAWTICAWGQYWQSVVFGAAGDARGTPSYAAGVGLGVGQLDMGKSRE